MSKEWGPPLNAAVVPHSLECREPYPRVRTGGKSGSGRRPVRNCGFTWGTFGLQFEGVDAEALMMWLKSTAAITNGSACSVAAYRPSHVLSAMGLSPDAIAESVRISWGPGTTAADFEGLIRGAKHLQRR